MFCSNCGVELADDAKFCSNCGNKIGEHKDKNIYIALLLSFFLTGFGSVYAGEVKKGLILFILRLAFIFIGISLGIFFIFSYVVWVYGFYEAYRDVQIANGHSNPNFINDFNGWDKNNKIIAVLVICIILFGFIGNSVSVLMDTVDHSDNSGTHYYSSGSGSSAHSSSSSSSHYRGVDTSPGTIARNDPDWYYDHYEYGDNPEIDDYLESQGYD